MFLIKIFQNHDSGKKSYLLSRRELRCWESLLVAREEVLSRRVPESSDDLLPDASASAKVMLDRGSRKFTFIRGKNVVTDNFEEILKKITLCQMKHDCYGCILSRVTLCSTWQD